jgi:hypothetical protein
MIMKFFKNLLKKKVQEKKFNILIIDEDSDLLHTALGITDERAEVLTSAILNEIRYESNLAVVIKNTADLCVHENEIAFAMMIVQRAMTRHNELLEFKSEFTNL